MAVYDHCSWYIKCVCMRLLKWVCLIGTLKCGWELIWRRAGFTAYIRCHCDANAKQCHIQHYISATADIVLKSMTTAGVPHELKKQMALISCTHDVQCSVGLHVHINCSKKNIFQNKISLVKIPIQIHYKSYVMAINVKRVVGVYYSLFKQLLIISFNAYERTDKSMSNPIPQHPTVSHLQRISRQTILPNNTQ